jgi:hypothetical protein
MHTSFTALPWINKNGGGHIIKLSLVTQVRAFKNSVDFLVKIPIAKNDFQPVNCAISRACRGRWDGFGAFTLMGIVAMAPGHLPL